MIIKIATCLIALSFFTACSSTNTASRDTLAQRRLAANTSTAPGVVGQPAPPAEGPEDVPAEGPLDPNRNPSLLPTPLLRGNAASSL